MVLASDLSEAAPDQKPLVAYLTAVEILSWYRFRGRRSQVDPSFPATFRGVLSERASGPPGVRLFQGFAATPPQRLAVRTVFQSSFRIPEVQSVGSPVCLLDAGGWFSPSVTLSGRIISRFLTLWWLLSVLIPNWDKSFRIRDLMGVGSLPSLKRYEVLYRGHLSLPDYLNGLSFIRSNPLAVESDQRVFGPIDIDRDERTTCFDDLVLLGCGCHFRVVEY